MRLVALQSPELTEPGIFGIFRQKLIWPESLSAVLNDEQIELILIHELAHAQRRDNLAAALHMVVEAAFWFHPMVWWIEKHLLEEREHACDEAVVLSGGSPEIYAEGLIKACRFCIQSPLSCVSGIAGSDLNKRIVSVMTLRLEKLGLSRKLLLTAVAAITIIGPVAIGLVDAQVNTQLPTSYPSSDNIAKPATANKDIARDLAQFAVATIKPVAAADSDPATMRFSDDGISFQKVPLAWVIQQAFSPQPTLYHQDDLVLGLPSWTKSERYDIEAKIDDENVPKWKAMSLSQRRLSLQSLLVARFNFQSHRETRERPTYSLVVAKNGPKLHKALLGETFSNGIKPPDGKSGRGESRVTPGKIVIEGSSLSLLANLLTSQGLDHAVVDKTGLAGLYDITLRWSPDDMGASDAALPSLFTALQEQLGLKLEYNKNPIEVIVIDRIEKPSAN